MNKNIIDRIGLNVNILINNNKSYSNIIIELNNNYPINKHPKLNAINELSVYILNLYYKYNKQNELMHYRYGQEKAYNCFKEKLTNTTYWGLMIAPRGKSMMHYIFMGYFFKHSSENILLITKRKDILTDVIKEIEGTINTIKICFQILKLQYVNNKLDDKINKCKNYSIVIVNSDDKKNDEVNPAKLNGNILDYFFLMRSIGPVQKEMFNL